VHGIVPVSINDDRDEAFAFERDLDALPRARSREPAFHAVAFRDNYVQFRRGLRWLVDPSLHARVVIDWMRGKARLGEVPSLHHHAIIDADGAVAGVWDYDADARRVVYATFAHVPRSQGTALASCVAALERFVRDELGDVRFYSLDNARNRTARLEGIRALRRT
jgi:hypothetical protein